MMKIQYLLFVLALNILFACQTTPAAEDTTNEAADSTSEVVVETDTYYEARGEDCDQPDSLQIKCAKIDFQFPRVQTEAEVLDKQVGQDVNAYLASILSMEEVKQIEPAAELFWQYREEAKDSEMYNHFTAESTYEVLLNHSSYLTIEVNGYTYQGGAHGSPTTFVQTYEVNTASPLGLEDIVTDLAALKEIAETHFRQERQDAFEQGFEFDDIFIFELTANFGLTEAGLYCHYMAYEVGPYALGNTIFTIPFADLDGLLKEPFRSW